MALSSKSLAGPGYIILNVLRCLNIIALMSVIAASIVMLVKTFVVSKFFFFDGCSNVITALTSMFLIVSELPILRGYFARNWPLLGQEHGFVFLGLCMVVLGVNVLGNLNKESMSQKSLGLEFWRLVIAAGILVFILGFFNILASYIFCDSSRGITARNVRAHGAVAQPTPQTAQKPLSIDTSFAPIYAPHGPPSPSIYSSPTVKESIGTTSKPHSSFHFKVPFSPAKTFKSVRSSILPSYYSSPTKQASPPYPTIGEEQEQPSRKKSKNKKDKRESVGPRVPINISGPLNVDTRFDHIIKPDMAHHPSTRGRDIEEGKAF